ncbi:MAG: PIN domain-containing protein [Burkholderiales bacterium]|nr:PIN domain-containing protein [Phycisphaerae bacterium]
MNTRIVDTNLIIRHLVQDHERHAKVAGKLFAACDRGDLRLVVLSEVIAECVFVLESFYKHPRAQIGAVIAELLSSPGIHVDRLAIHIDALSRYSRSKLHFVDCVIASMASAHGWPVATFDADLRKFPDVVVDVD